MMGRFHDSTGYAAESVLLKSPSRIPDFQPTSIPSESGNVESVSPNARCGATTNTPPHSTCSMHAEHPQSLRTYTMYTL